MEAPNEQLVIRKRKLESWANEDPLFDEEMTVPINNGEPISNDDQSIYPIANAKSELSIKRHSDAGDVSPVYLLGMLLWVSWQVLLICSKQRWPQELILLSMK